MKITADDKELKTFLKAINRQMKTVKSSFDCFPVPVMLTICSILLARRRNPWAGPFVGIPNLPFRLVMRMILCWMLVGCVGRFP